MRETSDLCLSLMLWELSPGVSKEEVQNGGSAEVAGEGEGSPGASTQAPHDDNTSSANNV